MKIFGRTIYSRFLGGSCLVLLFISFASVRPYPMVALVAIGASAFCFYCSREEARLSSQDWLAAMALFAPSLALLAYIHFDAKELRHFEEYLVANHCKLARENIRPASGRCDARTGMCDDEDRLEPVYSCPNGNEITYETFAEGGFESPSR